MFIIIKYFKNEVVKNSKTFSSEEYILDFVWLNLEILKVEHN